MRLQKASPLDSERHTVPPQDRLPLMGCRSWAAAEEKKRELEDQLTGRVPVAPTGESKLLEEAVQLFKTDKENQKVTDGVLEKYARELERLQSFAQGKGVFTVGGITRELLIEYQATWEGLYPSSNTRQMVQARLKNFLRFCYDSRWLERVPRLSVIQADEVPTLPLSAKEYQKLLATIPKSFLDVVFIPKSDKMPEHTRVPPLWLKNGPDGYALSFNSCVIPGWQSGTR